jgi:2-amino-4-hydroxy-6-hydroxymethyldihydropteridine diphosphokinase
MVFIGIGSNLGNRIQNIENAKYNLKINGINILKFSKYYETLSWPDPTKPKF